MTNLLRRALRRLLDFGFQLDREAMWQQWERDHVAPLRGQIGILNQGMAAAEDDRKALLQFNDELSEQVDSLRAKLSDADKAIASLTKDFTPAWDHRHNRYTDGPAPRIPWYRR